MAKKASDPCWALAAFRTRMPGQGVGISSAVPVAFWNGRRWVKDPVSLACGPAMKTQHRVLDMPHPLKKGAPTSAPVPIEMLIRLPSGKYDINPEWSRRGIKALQK